ncbi:MAG: peptidase, partial [Actinobacteria bacterium]|nr:peptidase [Actinomycetota bacterium]
MRFNPKARLDTDRTRDVGRGRRSGGGSGASIPIPTNLAGGGGVVGVIVVVLYLVLTQCIGGAGGSAYDTSRMADTGRYADCETGEDANSSSDCARVAVENSLFDYWSDELGSRFEPEQAIVTVTDGTGTGCGDATSDVGPFYCPVDQTIYL